jgi:signal transduction histidine kinase
MSAAESPLSLPLERRLTLVVLVLFTLVLGTSLGVSYFEVRRAAELSAADRLTSLAEVLQSMSVQQLATRGSLMRRVAHAPAIVAAVQSGAQPLSDSATAALAQLATTRADTLGRPELLTIGGQSIGPVKLELPMEVDRLRDVVLANADSVYVGPLHRGRTGVSFVMAVPVVTPGRRVVGMLVQERPVAANAQANNALGGVIGKDVDLYVRNADGSMWAALLGGPAAETSGSRRFLDGVDIVTRPGKGELMSSTATLAGTPLAITVERPMSVILARPLASIRVLTVLAIVLAAAGAAVAWLLTHQVVRPLGELTSAAEEIARGNFARRVHARRNDELGRLADAFNHMAERVGISSAESSRAVAQLTKSVETQQFLAEASRIVAGTLSDERLLADLSRHCVPRIADYCTIHVVDDDGALRRIATVHSDPAKQDAVIALVGRYQYRVDGPGEVPETIRSQRPVILPEVDVERIRRHADADTIRLLDDVRPTSFLCVPLVARGRAFGAMSFTMTDSGRRFSSADLEIATELASRTAVAIDNALIYRRSIALRLEADAASAAKSDFLAKMSHEIRTPINAMIGYAELLQMGIAGRVSDEQSVQLERIRASGEHLTALVNEILDLAKIEAGGMSIDRTTGIAGDAAEAALALIRPQATTKGIELESSPAGDAQRPYVGDPKRVQQILINLLSNAVKFTRPGGTVRIRCEGASSLRRNGSVHSGEWTCISVHDTGDGIAEHDLERIFHPFVQLDGGYTRAHGGTGLGLAISRSLAQMMGGELSVESALGSGSCFTLWLPSPDSCTSAG